MIVSLAGQAYSEEQTYSHLFHWGTDPNHWLQIREFGSSKQKCGEFVKNFTKRLASRSGRCFHDASPSSASICLPHPPSRRRRVSIAVE
jgi:hypothetical protein